MEKSGAVGRAVSACVRARDAPCVTHLEPEHRAGQTVPKHDPEVKPTLPRRQICAASAPAAAPLLNQLFGSALVWTEAGQNREFWHVSNRKATHAQQNRRNPVCERTNGHREPQIKSEAFGDTEDSEIKSREGTLAPGWGRWPRAGEPSQPPVPPSPAPTPALTAANSPGGVANLEDCG